MKRLNMNQTEDTQAGKTSKKKLLEAAYITKPTDSLITRIWRVEGTLKGHEAKEAKKIISALKKGREELRKAVDTYTEFWKKNQH